MDSDAPDRTPRTGRQRARVVGVTVVCLLAGILFGTSAALARQDRSGSPTDVPPNFITCKFLFIT